jgi:uncharacterized protein
MAAFIDANVFLYAIGAPSPYKQPCLKILEAVATGRLEASSDAEVVQEVMHVLGRRADKAKAIEVARGIITLFPGIASVRPVDLSMACDLLEKYSQMDVRDAIHLACMIASGTHVIISSDRHFDSAGPVQRIDPMNIAAVEALLGD